MRNKTVEEVYVEMLKPKDGIRLKVQYRPEEFTRIKGLPGDSFYIRYYPSEGCGAREGDLCSLPPSLRPSLALLMSMPFT
jgi:hypothetical protein